MVVRVSCRAARGYRPIQRRADAGLKSRKMRPDVHRSGIGFCIPFVVNNAVSVRRCGSGTSSACIRRRHGNLRRSAGPESRSRHNSASPSPRRETETQMMSRIRIASIRQAAKKGILQTGQFEPRQAGFETGQAGFENRRAGFGTILHPFPGLFATRSDLLAPLEHFHAVCVPGHRQQALRELFFFIRLSCFRSLRVFVAPIFVGWHLPAFSPMIPVFAPCARIISNHEWVESRE